MPRPKKDNPAKKTLGCAVPEETYNTFFTLAKKSGYSASQMLRYLVDRAIRHSIAAGKLSPPLKEES